MADIVPIKSDNGNLKSFTNGDTIPITHGGTGVSKFTSKGIVISNGTNKLETLKCEFNKTTDPSIIDDITEGFSVGSRWLNIESQTEWICLGNNFRDAIWIAGGGNGGGGGSVSDGLVSFEYDYKLYTWTNRTNTNYKDIIQVVYRLGGSVGDIVGTLNISYNVEYQPTLFSMTYADASVKTITINYDEDGYLSEMIKS